MYTALPDSIRPTTLLNDYKLSRKAASLNYFGTEQRKMLADMVSIFTQPWVFILYTYVD
jgi:hypothetical protein